MYKKTRKLFALCLTIAMLFTMVAFTSVASATTATTATKLAGIDRYATALKIAQAGWTTSDNVIIARGDDLADALAAAPLAYAKGKAPILLTKTNELPEGVLAELQRLKVKNVYIVGGPGAVSETVEYILTLNDFKTIRFGGIDRVDTSCKVASELSTIASRDKVVIANAYAYADALSISSIAAVNGMPILLVKDNQLSSQEASYINGKKVYAIGGTGVLSAGVVDGIGATRIAGLDRYETNAAILDNFQQNYNKIYIAKGTDENLVDALAGSALAALGNNPIVLVDGNSAINPNLSKVIKNHIKPDSTEVILGGTVSQSAADDIEALKGAAIPVKSVKLNKVIDVLKVSETHKLEVSVEPKTATNKDVKWTSSNPDVLTVNDAGYVRGVKLGVATITVASKADPSIFDSCIIAVVKCPIIPVKSVSLNKTEDILTVGETDELKASIEPLLATNKAVKWTSSNPDIVTVDDTGKLTTKITAKGEGKATITVTTADGEKKATCNIEVKKSLEIGKEYDAKDGMKVTVNGICSKEVGCLTEYTVKYTLKNPKNAADKKIDKGIFKMYFDNGTNLSQLGVIGSLKSGETLEKEYTFIASNTKKPTILEYDGDFCTTKPCSDTLKWKVVIQ